MRITVNSYFDLKKQVVHSKARALSISDITYNNRCLFIR
jgi:hypothetical protein